ncbi:DegT/DnrJ/EryC1/StrS family aminotransferase [Methylacidiphilum caldifontis]|nr:DegT/DnrJ/EryC1/StrS family aminotransferase [Methylacidiphilum caldifontis]
MEEKKLLAVPFMDLKRVLDFEKKNLQEAFNRVLESGRYILSQEVASFEQSLSAYLNIRHCIGVSSGSDALLLSFLALGIKPAEKVICPTFTFFATAGSIARIGARPVFADSCPGCFQLPPFEAQSRIDSETRGIVPVHLFGQCADMDGFKEIKEKNDIFIIEDSAQAFGASLGDKKAGVLGDVGCFSFFPTKNLAALGEAGLVVTASDEIAYKLKALRVHGSFRQKYIHELIGGNFRMDEVQAAFLHVRLNAVDKLIEQRIKNALLYEQAFLSSGIAILCPDPCLCQTKKYEGLSHWDKDNYYPIYLPRSVRGRHTFNQYVIRIKKERDKLRDYLKDRGIQTEIYYPMPLHLQPCFSSLGYQKGDFPIAEKLSQEVMALPIFPGLTEEEIERVVKVICQFFGHPYKSLP